MLISTQPSSSLVPIPSGYYYQTNKKEDKDFEDELRKKYSHNIDSSVRKRQDMVKFMDSLKKGEGDKRMDKVLQGGKGEMKRLYRVDEKLYGTQEGVDTKKRVEAELAQKRERKKKKKKAAAGDELQAETPSLSTSTKTAVGLAVVSAVAVVFFGGGRGQ